MQAAQSLAGLSPRTRQFVARQFRSVDADVPEFEANAETAQILAQLAAEVTERVHEATAVLTVTRQETAVQQARTSSLSATLQPLGMGAPGAVLSSLSQQVLDALAGVAETVGAADADGSAVICAAIAQLHSEIRDAERALRSLRVERASLVRAADAARARGQAFDARVAAARTAGEQMAREITARQQAVESNDADVKLLRSRRDELKRALAQTKVDPSVTHPELIALGSEVQTLRQRVAYVEELLRAFQDLPMDATLADVRVREAENELRDVTAEFDRRVAALQLTTQ